MPLPERILSKSKFSMYLRTQCERELYLSLFRNNPASLGSSGIPIPLKSRPNVQIITKSGREFEREQFEELQRAIPDYVICNPSFANINLEEALQLASNPSFIIQPEFEPESFKNFAFSNLGIPDNDQTIIPQLSGLRPDALFIHNSSQGEYEILPDGSRKRVESGDSRLGISVIDLKNISEANASYSAEVCLYAFFLANWIHFQGATFSHHYFVSDRIYLWKHVEMPEFNRVLNLNEGNDPIKRIEALLRDLEEGLVNYLIYMPSVRKFFKEDLPRVIRNGDTNGWRAVEYHVNSKCSACDWLGNPDWLNSSDLEYYASNPDHYCLNCAESSDHLSKMPLLSKGASLTLSSEGHQKISDLTEFSSSTDVLKKHTILKRNRKNIGRRANSIVNSISQTDNTSRIPSLASNVNAQFSIVVNFDSGSGFLTGIAIRGILFPPYGITFSDENGNEKTIHFLGNRSHVVPRDNLRAEWTALQSFIATIERWISEADRIFSDNNWGRVKSQIHFWESRQYEELCNAFGRHLINILSLPERRQKALAWLFPPEDLIKQGEQLSPGIVIIKDIIDSFVFLPVKFATTLLEVAESFHHPSLVPQRIDKYYREPLGNSIPRERIFEIWKSNTGTVRMFGRDASIQEAIEKYGSILKAHTWALSSISARLRLEFRGQLNGSAPNLRLSIPSGMNQVAYDSKLWAQWERISKATDRTEGKNNLITNPESLEASYKAIILSEFISDLGNYQYEFRVSEESTEAKIEEGDAYCTIGMVNFPGFPLETGASLGFTLNPSEDQGSLFLPMHKVVAAKVEEFNRSSRKIIISLRARSPWVVPVFDALMDSNVIQITTDTIYLLDGLPPDDSEVTIDILRELGNPICSQVATETRHALGVNATRRIPRGTSPDTLMAKILWDAQAITSETIRTSTEVQRIIEFAKNANDHELNDSQINAVSVSASKQLSIIWGPPGTGKTDTLVAMLHAFIFEAQTEGHAKNILITGPNYRTVEELSNRLLQNLSRDTNCPADYFWVYSRSREPKPLPEHNDHINAYSMSLIRDTPEVEALLASLSNENQVTIVSTTSHIVSKLPRDVFNLNSYINEIFDIIVIDESSQVPVSLSLRPLSVIKSSGQLIIGGDHLQMPPIHSLDPPKNAEYLVGSIQSYLISRFNIPKSELLINYRSNQDLVDYAKTLGYPANLVAYHPNRQLQAVNDLDAFLDNLPENLPVTNAYKELLVPERRVTALIHEDKVSSQANEFEAKLVAAIAFIICHTMAEKLTSERENNDLTLINDEMLFKEGVGIVTPHKAQKALVLKELYSLFPSVGKELIFDAVDTVERFQGGERQTIIVSFGVGDTEIIEGEEAFLLQMERTNVAVSRAKAKCIILMPKSLAYHLPTDQKAAETAVAIKSYMEEFCNQRRLVEININDEARRGEVRWHDLEHTPGS